MADDRRTVTVTLWTNDRYDRDTLFPGNVEELVVWLRRHLDAVPVEHRERVELDVSVDEYSLEATLAYDRPETDQEMSERLREAEEREARAQRMRRDQERAMYERLKKQFEADA